MNHDTRARFREMGNKDIITEIICMAAENADFDAHPDDTAPADMNQWRLGMIWHAAKVLRERE